MLKKCKWMRNFPSSRTSPDEKKNIFKKNGFYSLKLYKKNRIKNIFAFFTSTVN